MSQATRVLSALVLGLALGIGLATWSAGTATSGPAQVLMQPSPEAA